MKNTDIAIIGLSGRLPGISDLSELNDIFVNKVDCVVPFKDERRDLLKLDKDIKYFDAAYIDGVQYFDYNFFNISRQEAKNMDPQQKMILELAYSAIEDGGYSPDDLRGTNTSVMIGVHNSHMYDDHITDNTGIAFLGSFLDALAGRISYTLDLEGEAAVVETACSSSLYAIYDSCVKLNAGEADMALAGGITLEFRARPWNYAQIDNLQLISPSARCNTFDECADGINLGEGAGVLFLKRYDDAVRDKDPIYAVIKSAAANQDGGRSNSLTAPSSKAQADVIRKAIKKSGINAEEIGYIEAHGTGTKIGDPIEIQGLTEAFSSFTDKKQFCPIGSLKSNFSHLGSAAGVVSVIKGITSFENNKKYPLCRLNKVNPLIDFRNSPVYPITETESWITDKNRYIGISAFGASGTNVHVILGDHKEQYYGKKTEPEYLITVSGDREEAVGEYCANLLDDVGRFPLGDIAYTLNKGRKDFKFRTSFCVKNDEEMREKLKGDIKVSEAEEHKVIFLFSGNCTFSNEDVEYLSSVYPDFKKTYEQIIDKAGNTDENIRNFAVYSGIYNAIVSMGIAPYKIVSAGIGKFAGDYVSGKLELEKALEAVRKNNDAEVNYDAFKKFMADISVKSKYPVAVLEMGCEGVLAECIENENEFSDIRVIYALDSEKGSIYKAFSELYCIGVNIDWDKFYKATEYARVHISTYPFAKTYSWPDIKEKKRAAEEEKKTAAAMSRDEVAGILREVWAEELDIEGFDDDDDLFDLGANSIEAMDVADAVEERTNIHIEFSDMYKYTSVSSLADHIVSIMNSQPSEADVEPTENRAHTQSTEMTSYNQQRMLFLADQTSDAAVYNMSMLHKVNGEFDPEVFRKCLDAIVKRHDILHTIYRKQGDKYFQVVLEDYTFSNEYLELDETNDDNVLSYIRNYDLNVDLYSEIPIKSLIVKSKSGTYYWAVNLHHIAGDGYSYGVFASEVLKYYDEFMKNGTYVPQPLKTQYSDYIIHEEEFLRSKQADIQREFWKNELEGISGILKFPADKQRPDIVTYNGDYYEFEIGKDLFAKADIFAKSNNITLFMLIESAYALTLAKYTGSNDICVGIPFANRNSAEFKELIGFFVNTLIIRNKFNDDMTVRELLNEVRSRFLNIYINSEIPFEEIVNVTKFKRDRAYLPLIQFMLAYQNFGTGDIRNDAFSLEVSELPSYTSKFEMTATLIEQEDNIIGTVEYNSDLYYKKTIETFISNYISMLEQIIGSPDACIGSLGFSSPDVQTDDYDF
ncbi:MAG: mycosubtilin synthase subunit A [Ruminococcus sp.]|nr:mycosubtilin synthase subunit A [Ruminococcus sp.]